MKGAVALVFLSVVAAASSSAQTPSGTPEDNPTGNAGALKAQVQTAGSYDAHSANATRSVTDLHVPGALGVYGLDFTRYWNSNHNDYDDPNAGWPSDFGSSGWTHSWRWDAQLITWSQELAGDGGEEAFYTEIIITFPDGHTTKYKVVRSNRAHGIPPNVHPADPRLGPPYTDAELNVSWPDGGTGVHDHICHMAVDGSEFYLCLADGGSVHFDASYHATEVFDPHGFKTDLEYYPDGSLKKVTQAGGRYLEIFWGDFSPGGYHVISQVRSGGAAGVQTVSYEYSGPPLQGYFRVLNKVKYENEPTASPSPNDKVAAHYDYDFCYGDAPCSGQPQSLLPMLKYANDPHFAGPMTTIRYNYANLSCPPPVMNPLLYPDYFGGQPFSIAAEKASTGLAVSSFQMDCYGGTRREDNALGGWRQFYFGTSAGTTESAPAPDGPYLCRTYQLGKVTDFTSSGQLPPNIPQERQNFTQGGAVRHTWDGRNLRTEALSVSGDDSGEPSQINHPDTSSHSYNRTDPGSSAPLDASCMHNSYNHWLFSQTDELQKTTTYTRDGRRRVTRIDYFGGSAELFAYNSFNQVTSHTLPSGAVVTYVYDGRGLLQSESNSIDGSEARKDYTYDDFDRVKTVSDGRSRAAGAPYSTWTEYNGRHQAIKVHYAPTNGGDPKVMYGYDDNGNCTSITDELGHTKTYEYDLYRRCIALTESVDSQHSRRWDWIYDRYIGGIGWRDRSAHTSNSWRIQLEPGFNAAGDRPMTNRWHDVNQRITLEQTGWIQPGNQSLGNWYPGPDLETHYFTYDENGQKSSYTDPVGRQTTYEYDNRNRLWKTNETVNTIPRTTETLYDTVGNKTMVKFPVEAAGQRTQQWLDYDEFGQPRRFIDERGNTTDLTYVWGRMKKLYTVTTHRDKDGGGTENQQTTFSNDLMGKPTQVLFPDGTHEDTTYYCAVGLTSCFCDQPHSFTTRKGQQKIMTYDARGREISHTWSDATPGITRIWDDASRMTSISNVFSTITFQYDDASQVQWEQNNVAGSGTAVQMNYRRYGNGNVAYLQYPDGIWVYRQYTARGQLQSVWDSFVGWQQVIAYTYLADGKVDYADYQNGIRTNLDYDGRGMTQLVEHFRRSDHQNYSRRQYWRDERDRITAFQKSTDNAVNPMENGRGDRFRYDAEGQLVEAWYNAANPAVSGAGYWRYDGFEPYDSVGNRTGWKYVSSRGWMNFGRRDNGLNQYSSWENEYPDPPLHWGSAVLYDDNFNQDWHYPGNGVMMAEGWFVGSYNALNQPKVIIGPSSWVWFGYDPLGRCVKRWNGSNGDVNTNPAKYFYYEGWNLIEESQGAGSVSRNYIHGARVDEIVKQLIQYNPAAHYFHYDARGHCTLQTDTNGNIAEQYEYDAFGYPYFYDANGNPMTVNGQPGSAWGNRFLFAGREWLSDLKLYDYRNRLYQPELGRFLQPDPKEFSAGDYNLYRYCHNDPVNKSDPTGLDAVLNSDGQTYHFVIRPELVMRNLVGTHITNPNPRYTEQCATGGQFLTGTNIQGRIHDAPATRTWTQGDAVSRNTPMGTLIARGWENSAYPNRAPNEYKQGELANHVGIYNGAGDKPGYIKVLDQYAGRDGVLRERQYPANQGWSVVHSADQYDPNTSRSAVRAIEIEKKHR